MRCSVCLLVAVLCCLYAACGAQECLNGRAVAGECQCEPGWIGPRCDVCGGRIRLNESSGTIAEDLSGMDYPPSSSCVFFIEAESPAVAVNIKLLSFHTECQWDYLHVFDGDSVFSPKLAAFTGDIQTPQASPDLESESSASGSGMGSAEPVPTPYQSPVDIALSSSGPRMLFYFYSDAGLEKPGFEIAYWLDSACPNNCSGNGVCDNGTCVCEPGWSGDQCHAPFAPGEHSVDPSAPHWATVDYTFLANEALLQGLPRAAHSAVVWRGLMIVYGGYRFPTGQDQPGSGSGSGCGQACQSGSGSGDGARLTLLCYELAARSWDGLETGGQGGVPQERYGHTAVIFNDTMYVFGGSLLASEEITNELWALDLLTLSWTLLAPPTYIPSPHPLNVSNGSSVGGGAEAGGGLVMVEVPGEGANDRGLPVPVRSHTALVVGSSMVVIFGLSSEGQNSMLNFVQEYDFVSGMWTAPPQYGFRPEPRMGHSSVYHSSDGGGGVVLVYGGRTPNNGFSDSLWSYDPQTFTWAQLTGSGVGGSSLHAAVLTGLGDMLVFGGDEQGQCFNSRLLLYHSQCDSWEELEFSGLLGNASRYGHSMVLEPASQSLLVFGGFLGVLRHDVLTLNTTSDCAQFSSREDCLNTSQQLCGWGGGASCSPALQPCAAGNCSVDTCDSVIPDVCRFYGSCLQCSDEPACAWNASLARCLSSQQQPGCDKCEGGEGGEGGADVQCGRYTECLSCHAHQDCVWARNGSSPSACYSSLTANASSLPPLPCPPSPCTVLSSCAACADVASCLWCPTLQQCVSSSVYPISYPYGQCLAWVNGDTYTCPGACESRLECSSCQDDVRCGWCNDASDTGLGLCTAGGFGGPQEAGNCLGGDTWTYDLCPACQCNGHSSCVNGSVCESCQNGTTGDRCQRCEDTTFGNPRNGGTCQPCDCNGYSESCDPVAGSCDCEDSGVIGERCTECDSFNGYVGDADNFCFFDLLTGFIYAFSVDDSTHRQTFLVTTPPENKHLNFRLEITSNPNQATVVLQFFLARRSENLWVVANLTDAIPLTNSQSFRDTFFSFSSNANASLAQLLSFVRPSIAESANFSELFENATEDDFTSAMWDGDVTLVVRLSNLTSAVAYRITVDQQDLLFLLYFFATFVLCFTVLLGVFLFGWYIKKKVQYRAYVRQQYIELRRRVARPFAKLKLVIDKPTVDEQYPSYVSVETCKDEKTAVLSLLVRLPGERGSGRPLCGRTGICTGSTLVRVNKKARDKAKGKQRQQQRHSSTSHTRRTRTAVET